MTFDFTILAIHFPSLVKPNEPFLDLPEGDELSTEQLDAQVQRAQEQLLSLKRQQDLIEKQKRELEELSRRQEQLQQGKTEMVEKFTRAAVVLERELYDSQKRVEQLREIQEAFSQHYNILESINPKGWGEGGDLNRELSKALSAVDDARAEFSKSLPKIQPESPAAAYAGEEDLADGAGDGHDFGYWLKSGFAFTLPLLALGFIALLAFVFLR
ncbi:MAG: hypothetical protein PHQ12_01555 [Chthoniobacteraceae bacterium]|nr:hypothetical protein [Chthoniobacteraceae bacterium]